MTIYRGTPVSEGVAAGELYLPDTPGTATPGTATPGTATPGPDTPGAATPGTARQGDATVTAANVRAAFAAVAAERAGLAAALREAGRDHEAGIVEIGALIAADPALSAPALAVLEAAVPVTVAVTAILDAAQTQAAVLESLPDPDLAQRSGDVRQVAAAVVTRLAGSAVPPPPTGPFILVRREVDPADLIRLADQEPGGQSGRLVGAVSVAGGASSHAAIVARGLGLPMLTGIDPGILTALASTRPGLRGALIDATAGSLVTDPKPEELARVPAETREAAPGRVTPGQASTRDGELITVLGNVASAAETRLGLANGAAGVGLLRTEIPFTHAAGWPSREQHLAQLTPILALLTGRRAVVRLLDFAGDKVPPFPGAEGLRAFLDAPGALAAQLAAILEAGAGTDLAIMIPMVRSLAEVEHVRRELAVAAKQAGFDAPPLGMMVELADTAAHAAEFAPHVDFFSIGTNDLTADVLGRPRVALRPSDSSERTVLSAIAHVTAVAGEAKIGLSVCGDAAADESVLPLLLGLGVRTVSVGAANVAKVANWITGVDASKVVSHDAD